MQKQKDYNTIISRSDFFFYFHIFDCLLIFKNTAEYFAWMSKHFEMQYKYLV